MSGEGEGESEVNRSNIVFSKHSTAIGTFPLSVREASVYAFFTERVATTIDDDTLESKVASRTFEHFLKTNEESEF